MEATISGENDEGIGVWVTDTSGVEHGIEMEFDGRIIHHEQDGYPDEPEQRTNSEHESVFQSRRYARYHVYREKGYDTLEPMRNPDRIAATLIAIESLSDEEFLDVFGDYYRQTCHHFADDIEAVVEPAVDIESGDFLLYMQDVYLQETLDEIQALGVDYAEQFTDIRQTALSNLSLSDLTTGISELADLFGAGTVESSDGATLDVPEYTIDGVSGIHMKYYEDTNEDRIVHGDQPFPDREPDARLQFVPIPTDDVNEYRAVLNRHLLCQIRDCFIGMGEQPPEGYRVLGPGIDDFTVKYRHFDCYENYHDWTETVDGYRM